MTARMRRVNESVRAVVAEALGDLKDPRIGLVTVTGVSVSPDLREGPVYVSVLGNEKKRVATLAGLESAHAVVQARVARDGSITLPLLGTISIGSNTVEQAIGLIRDGLAKDYLVNPQVSLSIVEYAKRRFTVLGQVNRPGTYEMPGDDQLNLLQAIAMAGGYTRIGAPNKITVQRVVSDETKIFKLNAESMAKNKGEKPFEILQEDTITVGEKWI